MSSLLLFKAIRALREGRIGDAGAYKAAALTGAPYPEVLQAVRALSNPIPDIPSLMARTAPGGSVGDAYVQFVHLHGITPLCVSDTVRAELEKVNVVAVRYLALHDLFHVLLGFDVSRPGELAVWSFVAAQRYSSTYGNAAKAAQVIYPLLQPSAWSELRRQRIRGEAMGRFAPCLLGIELESYWRDPLEEVRTELRLSAANGEPRG